MVTPPLPRTDASFMPPAPEHLFPLEVEAPLDVASHSHPPSARPFRAPLLARSYLLVPPYRPVSPVTHRSLYLHRALCSRTLATGLPASRWMRFAWGLEVLRAIPHCSKPPFSHTKGLVPLRLQTFSRHRDSFRCLSSPQKPLPSGPFATRMGFP